MLLKSKKAKANEAKTEERAAFEELENSVNELKFMVKFSTGNTMVSRKQMTRLERNKSEFSKYVDMIVSGKCEFTICPYSKAAIKIWNEKMQDAGLDELFIDDPDALRKSIDSDMKEWKEDHLIDKKNIKKARKMMRKEKSEEKKNRSPIFKSFKRKKNEAATEEPLTGETMEDIIDSVFAEMEHPVEDGAMDDIDTEDIIDTGMEKEDLNNADIDEKDSNGPIVSDPEFDANTGFVEPNFTTSKVSPIIFDNDKLSGATYDSNGQLIIDDIERSYEVFKKIYPQIETFYDMAKWANYRTFFSDYIDPIRTPIPVPGLISAEIIDDTGKVVNKLILDINCIYGNGLMVLTCGKGKTLLDEVAVNITKRDFVYAMMTRSLSDAEVNSIMGELPDNFRNILYHVDMSSLKGKKFTSSQYTSLLRTLSGIFSEENWDEMSKVDARFRFDRYKSIDNFDLICDEWVTFIPDVAITAPENHYNVSKERFWISYNGRKNNKIETGNLQIAAINPNKNNDPKTAV